MEIEGADGSIDYTDFFGRPNFGNVTHKFTFSSIIPRSEHLTLFTQIKNALHGEKLRIILDDDPGFYYVGRCYVSPYTNEKGAAIISIECVCEPYKYKLQPTQMSVAVNGTADITLPNGKKRAVPEIQITTDTSLNIVYQTYNVWDLGSGNYTLPELELLEGNNVVTVTGVGSITFTWQEAML